ncbi:MAG: glycerate kinase [Bacteroidales bacterium]|nr:glycerate kinase [Bacteroidales bacterium]
MKAVANQIFSSGVDSVLPDKMIQSQIKMINNTLYVEDFQLSLDDFQHIYVLGAGKASALMAKGLEDVLGERITEGHVVVKYGHTCALTQIHVSEAAHPTPDLNGIQATNEILEIAGKANKNDLVICLISGGASALLADCPKDSTLDDLILLNQVLLRCGANIKEMNAVRKHLSKVKGGQLAKVIYPATSVSLILSDVIGDSTDVIASGPTSPDSSTFEEALQVLVKYKLLKKCPSSMVEYLTNGFMGLIPETPKSGDPIFKRSKNIIIGSNKKALEAAGTKAVECGFQPCILTSELDGDLVKAADFVLESAFKIQDDPQIRKPVCLLAGGEPTIKVKGNGLGGRNQHFALYCATKISEKKGLTILCAGTDGNDGPTDAAGAVIDGNTVMKALENNLDPQVYLDTYDSYHFFKKAGGHIMTGSTMTNVMDLVVVLIE